MRIGIDGSSILPEHRTGIGNYTLNLLRSLTEIDQKNEYIIFLNSYSNAIPDFDFLKKPNVTVKHFRIPGPLLVRSWRYLNNPSIEFLTGPIDVFHSPASYIPPQRKGAAVTTVHDLYFMRNPENCESLGGKHFLSTFPKLLPKMNRIIVPSFFTKKELAEIMKFPENKISVVYEGVNLKEFQNEYTDEVITGVLKEYCLPSNYILFVGTIEPRKNIEGLLLAYKRLREILNNPPKLVIIGRKGLEAQKIIEMATNLDLLKDIIFTGFVSQPHLPILYKRAIVFVYPSLYEGFGLPVLEAMASNVPVVVSKNSALVETAGDEGCFIDPENYYQIAEKLRAIITSRKLRAEIIEKSQSSLGRFSWKSTAEKTLKVYEEAVADHTSQHNA